MHRRRPGWWLVVVLGLTGIANGVALGAPPSPSGPEVVLLSRAGGPAVLVGPSPTALIAAGVEIATSTDRLKVQPRSGAYRSAMDQWLYDTPRPWSLAPAGPEVAEAIVLTRATAPFRPARGSITGPWGIRPLAVVPLRDIETGMAILRDAAARMPPIDFGGKLSDWPPDRWRVELLSRPTLAPSTLKGTPGSDSNATRAWADATRDAVASAIAVIAAADRAVAEQVARRLLLTAELPDLGPTNVRVPMWAGETSTRSLVDQVLAPDLTRAAVLEIATAWLSTQREWLVWTIDDAGQRDGASGLPVGVLGLLSLNRAVVPRISANDSSTRLTSDVLSLSPGVGRALSVTARFAAPPASTDSAAIAAAEGVNIAARFADMSMPANVALRPAPLRPPGLPIGPSLEDWTLETFSVGTLRPRAGVSAVVMLDAETRRARVVFEGELKSAQDQQAVTLYLGTPGSSTLIAVLSGDGKVTGEQVTKMTTRFALSAQRWSAVLDLPEEAVEPDGTIRLGWTLIDSSGRRSSWPRPQLPWQSEPGRIAIDTRAWDEGLVKSGE